MACQRKPTELNWFVPVAGSQTFQKHCTCDCNSFCGLAFYKKEANGRIRKTSAPNKIRLSASVEILINELCPIHRVWHPLKVQYPSVVQVFERNVHQQTHEDFRCEWLVLVTN